MTTAVVYKKDGMKPRSAADLKLTKELKSARCHMMPPPVHVGTERDIVKTE